MVGGRGRCVCFGLGWLSEVCVSVVCVSAWAGRNGNGGAFGTFLERIPGFAIQNIPDSLPRRYRSYKRLHITDLRYVTARLHSRRSYTMRNVYATLHRLHTSYVRTCRLRTQLLSPSPCDGQLQTRRSCGDVPRRRASTRRVMCDTAACSLICLCAGSGRRRWHCTRLEQHP